MPDRHRLRRAATVPGVLLALGAVGSPATAAADAALAPSMLNTTCSLDQIMAATRAVDPVSYGNLVGRFNAQPRWIQGGITYHMTTLLQTPPPQRQAVADQLAGRFPEFVALFTVADPVADEIAAKCPAYPAEDPAVWNPARSGSRSAAGSLSRSVQRRGDLLGHPAPVGQRGVGVAHLDQ